MNRIEQAVKELPEGVTCFVLEIAKPGSIELTKAIGKLLKEHRPFCVLFSITDYSTMPEMLIKFKEEIKYTEKLDDNVILFNQTKESFLKNNTTKFKIIFTHNAIDAVPYEQFLLNGGKKLVASTLEISEVLTNG